MNQQPPFPLQDTLACLDARQADWISRLEDFIRIPSVSFEGFPMEKVRESAAFTETLLKGSGLENVRQLHIPGAHPYVYGDWLHAPGAPTLLLYAHHDVQPPMRLDRWHSPPFEPQIRGGRLFGRGSADDKAGVLLHAASVEACLQSAGRLPVNVRILIEGEEEIGSPHLAAFVKRYREQLAADCMILTDLPNFDCGVPSLTVSLRGLVCVEVEIRTLDHPLHSGMWGGPLPDAAMALSRMLSTLTDANGQLTDPEWQALTPDPDPDLLEAWRLLPMDLPRFREQAGILEGVSLTCDPETVYQSLWGRPSLVINSMESGGKGIAGNVLMDRAWCRIGVRIPPGMDPSGVYITLCRKIRAAAPWGVEVAIHEDARVPAWSTATRHSVFQTAMKALSEGYGREAVACGCGATIPFAGPLSENLGNIPALLLGIEDPYTNAHSENESLLLSDFQKALRSQVILFHKLGSAKWPEFRA